MATSTNYGWSEPDDTSLVKDGALAMRTLGNAIDTSVWNVGFGQAGKNKIINGDFGVNQRNFTSTTTSGTFGMDRWRFVYTGGTTTFSTQAFTPGTAPVAGYESTNFARLVTTGQSAAADRVFFNQRIENVRTFAGQTATISFWAKAATGTPKINVIFGQSFGATGSVGVNSPFGTVTTISTSWVRYSFTIGLPSITGKTISGGGDHLSAFIYVSDGGDYGSSVTAQNNTFDIWGVQVEAGSKATPFQTASGGSFQGELAMCQRYFQIYGGALQDFDGSTYSTTAARFYKSLPVIMRITPVATFPAAPYTNYVGEVGTGTRTPTAFATASNSTSAVSFDATGMTGANAFRPVDWNATAQIQFSSEL